MLISSLVLELWQFSLIKDWPEIRISKFPSLSFAQICPNLARMSEMYKMLLNAEKYQGYSFYRLLVT